MLHSIKIEAGSFAESLKAAQNYACKESDDSAMSQILIAYHPKEKKISVIACDGHGYYERKLPVIVEKKAKPSLPGKAQQVCISCKDAAMLVKLIPARMTGSLTLEIEEVCEKAKGHQSRLIMPDGTATIFVCRTDLDIPDYEVIRKKAQKAKNFKPNLSDVNIPVHELIRAGKVFPSRNGNTARVFTTTREDKGVMLLMEYIEADTDIKVIFMSAITVAEAA